MLRHFFSSLPFSFLLISQTGEKLGQYTAKTAAPFFNSSTHQLISVRQDPPVVKIVPIVTKPSLPTNKVIPKKQKEVKIGPTIADHDLSLKHEQLLRFLEKGYIVKLHTAKPLSPELTRYVIHKKMDKKGMIYDLKIK
jgi:translation initiation factor IF-3